MRFGRFRCIPDKSNTGDTGLGIRAGAGARSYAIHAVQKLSKAPPGVFGYTTDPRTWALGASVGGRRRAVGQFGLVMRKHGVYRGGPCPCEEGGIGWHGNVLFFTIHTALLTPSFLAAVGALITRVGCNTHLKTKHKNTPENM